MARSRNIKPALFKNELLGEADPLLTILFTGLWCLADREGRMEDRPKRIKAEIFPYRDIPDINGYLTDLEQLGFIARYSVGGRAFIQVENFAKHQSPHKTERASEIPENPCNTIDCDNTEQEPLYNGGVTDKESLIPDTLKLIPDKKERQKPVRFIQPSVDEVRDYIAEKGYSFSPEAFVAFYDSNGWMVGKNKMKSWKSACVTWAERDRGQTNENGKSAYQQRNEDFEARTFGDRRSEWAYD